MEHVFRSRYRFRRSDEPSQTFLQLLWWHNWFQYLQWHHCHIKQRLFENYPLCFPDTHMLQKGKKILLHVIISFLFFLSCPFFFFFSSHIIPFCPSGLNCNSLLFLWRAAPWRQRVKDVTLNDKSWTLYPTFSLSSIHPFHCELRYFSFLSSSTTCP